MVYLFLLNEVPFVSRRQDAGEVGSYSVGGNFYAEAAERLDRDGTGHGPAGQSSSPATASTPSVSAARESTSSTPGITAGDRERLRSELQFNRAQRRTLVMRHKHLYAQWKSLEAFISKRSRVRNSPK